MKLTSPINGPAIAIIRSSTNEPTTVGTDAPITIPGCHIRHVPLRENCLNSLIMPIVILLL